MTKTEWTKKITIIVIGSITAAYGITLALYAGFGGATLAVLWQGISKTFHVSIGMASQNSTNNTRYCNSDYWCFIRWKGWHMYNCNNHYLRTSYSAYINKNKTNF